MARIRITIDQVVKLIETSRTLTATITTTLVNHTASRIASLSSQEAGLRGLKCFTKDSIKSGLGGRWACNPRPLSFTSLSPVPHAHVEILRWDLI